MPVDSNATVSIPHCFNQSANWCRSGVKAWKLLTGCASRSAGTPTTCSLAPTSIPAAFGWMSGRLCKQTLGLAFFFFLGIGLDVVELSEARPGRGIGLEISPTGSSLSLFSESRHQTSYRQKAGAMLANGHKGTKQASA